jgi:hypothetical protein
MANFSVAIIVKDDGSANEQLAQKAIAAINKFDTELEVPAYKRYFDSEDIERMKAHYKVNEVAELVPHLEDWNGESGGVDEKGLYANSMRNPNGHFDGGDLLGRVLPEDWGTAFLGEGNNRICHALVTLDGKWIDGPWIMFEPRSPEQKKELDNWLERLRSVLEENKAEAVFIADCRS